MVAQLDIYNDVINGKLVLGLSNSGAFSVPDLYAGTVVPVRYFPVRPTNSAFAPFYTLQDVTDLTLRIAIGPRGGTALVDQETWAVVAATSTVGKHLAGTLDLTGAGLTTALGSDESITSVLEIRITEDSNTRVSFQGQVRIYDTVI